MKPEDINLVRVKGKRGTMVAFYRKKDEIFLGEIWFPLEKPVPSNEKLMEIFLEGLGKEKTKTIKIKDLEDYDASKVDDAPLRDDWRIACAWYATIREGKEFKYTEKQVEDLATKIVEEIVRRKLIEFRPEEMTKWTKILFNKVEVRLNAKGIKIPVAVEKAKKSPDYEELAKEGEPLPARFYKWQPKCLTSKASVITDQGTKRISSLVIGDKVLTRDGFKKVKRIYKQAYEGPMVTIRGRFIYGWTQLTTTFDHEIATPSGFEPIQDLNVGDLVLVKANTCRYCGKLVTPGRKYHAICMNKATASARYRSLCELNCLTNSLRAFVEERSKGLCEVCGEPGVLIHHIVPNSQKYLIKLCKDHHHDYKTLYQLIIEKEKWKINESEFENFRIKDLPKKTSIQGFIGVPIKEKYVRQRRLNVWNIEVEDTPEFVVSGVLVHNCKDCKFVMQRHWPTGEKIPFKEEEAEEEREVTKAVKADTYLELYESGLMGCSFAKQFYKHPLIKDLSGILTGLIMKFRDHVDFRLEINDSLIGFTAHPPIPKGKTSIDSIEARIKAGEKSQITPKYEHPKEWLTREGELKFPTRHKPGQKPHYLEIARMKIYDKGEVKFGVQRKDLHEYFFYGKVLKGRWVLRKLRIGKERPHYAWLLMRPKDQKPLDPLEHRDKGYYKIDFIEES